MSDEINLVLPWPVSANRYWRAVTINGHAMMVPTKEAKAYKQEVGWLAKQSGIRKPIAGRVSIEIKLFPQRPKDWAKRAEKNPFGWDDDVRCIDLDNANKVIFDALRGVVIDDDRWVRSIRSDRMEPDGAARVQMVVRKIAPPTSPQGCLL
jgi:crossover junction endodeoxyribonuclease RusA